jgi:serine protease Do
MRDMKFIRSITLGIATALVFAPVDISAQKPSPSGWVGLLITTGIGEQSPSGRLVFHDYPVIESIDPGSPAERAGLQAGDVLISINKQDFKANPIPMNELLIPGRTIVFRYRRENVERLSKLVVADRPAGTSPQTVVQIVQPIRTFEDERLRVREEAARRGLMITKTRVPVTPNVIISPLVFGSGVPSIAVAGAELTQLNDGLREFANIKGNGVFVINVPAGSLASASGLRSGDVIIRANKQIVENPGQLIRFMIDATDNSLPLQVLRRKKVQNLTLRW